jgi:hypothetical protein
MPPSMTDFALLVCTPIFVDGGGSGFVYPIFKDDVQIHAVSDATL